MIPVSILGTYWYTPQKGLLNWKICQSISLYITKFKHFFHNIVHIHSRADSSTTHVPTIHRSFPECVQWQWFMASAHAEHNGNISLELLLYGRTGLYSFLEGKTLHFIIPSLSKQSRGQSAPTYTSGWPTGNFPYLRMQGNSLITSTYRICSPCLTL